MGRLISWPTGIGRVTRQRLTGPRAIGAAATESLTAYVQTSSSPYGLWRWSFSVPPLRGVAARRWRGMTTALHGGANALRVTWSDPDRLSIPESGVLASAEALRDGLPWSDGEAWAGGETWRLSRPLVRAAAAADWGDTIIDLDTSFWGGSLDYGDQIGFVGVFAMHEVTQRIAAGRYRIWPPLRADVSPTMWATLDPVLAMRLESEAAADHARGVSHTEPATITLVEIEHADVVDDYL